jgi:hypothetical protein
MGTNGLRFATGFSITFEDAETLPKSAFCTNLSEEETDDEDYERAIKIQETLIGHTFTDNYDHNVKIDVLLSGIVFKNVRSIGMVYYGLHSALNLTIPSYISEARLRYIGMKSELIFQISNDVSRSKTPRAKANGSSVTGAPEPTNPICLRLITINWKTVHRSFRCE